MTFISQKTDSHHFTGFIHSRMAKMGISLAFVDRLDTVVLTKMPIRAWAGIGKNKGADAAPLLMG